MSIDIGQPLPYDPSRRIDGCDTPDNRYQFDPENDPAKPTLKNAPEYWLEPDYHRSRIAHHETMLAICSDAQIMRQLENMAMPGESWEKVFERVYGLEGKK